MSGLPLVVLLLGQAAPVTSPGTELRAVTVNVLDAKDGGVAELGPSDVALTENGVSRDIASFKRDRRPLSAAILVDSSAATEAAFRVVLVDAVSALVARLPEGTRYAVWTTGDRATKLLDFTDDRQAAAKALRMAVPRGGNTMLDALVEASADLRKNAREGDRTGVVALTMSGPEVSYRDRLRAAEEAEGNAELFLSVEVDEGDADFETRSSLSYVMERLAQATGGRFEVVLSPMGADDALRQMSTLLKAGYRLTYATVPDLKKRKLGLSVARPGTKVLLPETSTRQSPRS